VEQANPQHDVIFESDRLFARLYRDDDANAMFENYRDPDVWRWMGGGAAHSSATESLQHIRRYNERSAAEDPWGIWAVEVKKTAEMIGTVLVSPLESGPEIEVGYYFGKRYWGFGYATEITRAAIRYGFGVGALNQICGVVFPENIASQRVLEKAGMTYQGQRHTFGFDMRYYTISRAEGAAE
jgi:ribosomal-protein-alanine N-acetyltransferase